ncbi:sodium-coupled monocarboxylate transporter 1-like [Asbolus verrucosus]|uniref:Sodium-coupled monocarboxylate transporter 1-like n=1 Tax=Asbolus verrucosus TaxID=1661398 RepID=A0A482VQC5_ASBVE|nr:sodium-coupled monocarboxylate transporter 1-like [Asbolus verrucosus]
MTIANSTLVETLTTVLPKVTQNVAKVSFSWYDYVLFCLMLSLSVLIRVYFGCFGSKQSTADEYLMGNRKMKVFPISVSLVASHISGITLLAVPADIYRFGATYWLFAPSAIIVTAATLYVYLPVFYKLQITSTYEYLERRFDNSNRMFASFLFALGLFLYLPIVIYIPALAFSAATGISVHYISPVVCSVCIIYTTLGGLKAVVWTDTLQFTVTIGAVITVFFLGVKSAGGFGAVWAKAIEGHRLDIFDFDPDPTKRDSFWIVTIGLSMGWLAMTGINQSCVQKFLTVIYFYAGIVVVSSFSVFTGLIMYSKYATCDPFTTGAVQKNDQLLPYYIMDVASHIPGLSGLFIAGIFCAALSTLSASLNCLAGTMYEDFVLKFIGPSINDKTSSYILKLIVIIIGGALYGSIFGLLFSGWIVVMAQYYKSQGLFSYEPKPTSIEGCFPNITTFDNITAATTLATMIPASVSSSTEQFFSNFTLMDGIEKPEKFKPFFLFRISYYYYAPLGTIVTIICALLISYTLNNDDPPVHRDLLSPVIYFMLSDEKLEDEKKDYYSLERALHLVTTNCEKAKSDLNY